jgi:16S rRNA (cytosine1402-N4)-methyltransferase
MVREVIEGLSPVAGKWYVDATLGGAGHTTQILQAGGNVIGIDADSDALLYARQRIKEELPEKKEGEHWVLVKGNFRDIAQIVAREKKEEIFGVLMDLGVSSHQLDAPEKGFSYRFAEAPLDMRLNQQEGDTAQMYINSATSEELYEVFTKFGEEERAWPIVHALSRARQIKKFETVGDVVTVVKSVVGDNKQTSSVLSRIFQALRIRVNDELETLNKGLSGAEEILARGGRLAVISFHSLEDRQVKLFMAKPGWTQWSKKPLRASPSEEAENVRARSAKLRVATKV